MADDDWKKINNKTEVSLALEYLQQIHNFIQKLDMKDVQKIEKTLEYILPNEDLKQNLTNKDDGVLRYIKGNIGGKIGKKDPKIEKSKQEALKIIQYCFNPKEKQPIIKIAELQNFMWKKCDMVMDVMKLLIQNANESAKVKVLSIEIMILIFTVFENRISPTAFDLPTLYQKLLFDSDKSGTPSVKGKVFQCLGHVASFGLNTFMKAERTRTEFIKHYVNTVKTQVESGHNKLEVAILLGCVKGLDKYLQSFLKYEPKTSAEKQQIDDPNSEFRIDLNTFFEKLEQIIDPKISIQCEDEKGKLKRREFQRAGLEFLANHGEFFRAQFLKKYSELYNDIIPWAKSGNFEDSRAGMNAMQRFLEVIFHSPSNQQQFATTSISSQSQNNPESVQNVIVQYFINTFSKILDDKECHRSELTIGIIGVSLLSNLCTHKMIEGLFIKIIKQIESIIIELSGTIVDKYSSPLVLVPTYLEAVGKMLMVMDMSDEDSRQLFQNRLLIVENLSVLLITSYPDLPYTSKPKAAKAFLAVVHALYNKHNKYLESFLEHVIHEACTHIIASPTQLEKEILIESIKQEQKPKTGQNNKSSFTKINTVTSYTWFWTQIFNGPRDYYYSSSSTTTVSDPNLIQLIYNTMIEWILKTINKLDLTLIYVDIDEDDAAENNAVDPVYNTKANTIKDFQLFYNIETLFEQLVEKTEKIQLFNSWVEVFIEKILFYIKENNLVSGFYRIMALVFGQTRKLSYFETDLEEHEEMFNLCCEFLEQISIQMKDFRDDLLLGVLEIWLAVPDQMILKSHPCLGETLESVFRMGRNSFALAMRGIKAIERWFQIPEFPDEEMELLFNRLFPIWKSYFTVADSTETEEKDKGKTDVVSNLERKKIQAIGRETEKNPTLATVQRKLLHLIGSYAHLLDVDVDEVQAEFSTETRFLKYGVPFKDIKPDVYLDDFLPRILDLCNESSERQLKTLACEVFHSLVTYFIGHYSSNHGNCPYDLCHRILTAVINLGCDSDLVVRQLFNPLSIQIIRWSTLPNLEIGDMTLRVIIDGLVQSENSSRRDFSGVCLQEYFESCLKNVPSGTEQKGRKVLKYLIALSEHASSQYRHGSVLGFNSIYKNYRERRELSVQFAFQLICSFIVNLSLSHDFEENSLLIRTTKLAIIRMERIILREQENLNTPMERRKIPSNMTGTTLKDLVDWLLMKSGESWAVCRKECFRLIKSFAPKLRGIGSLENYLNNLDTLKLQAIAEHSYSEEIKALEFSSDFYSFLHESNYPIELTIRRTESTFLDMLQNFVVNFDAPIETNYINLNSDTFIHYSKALKVFYNVGRLPNTILSHELFERILFLSVLVCRSLNDKTPSNIHHLVETWKKIWTECKFSSNSVLGKRLHGLFKLDLEEEYIKVNRVLWLKQVAQYGFLSEIWNEQYTCIVLNDIWKFLDNNLFEKCQTGFEEKFISNKTKNLLEALFDLALQLGERGDVIVEKVFDRTIVNQDRKTNARVFQSKGEVFQKLFLPLFPYCEELLDFQALINKKPIQHVGQLVQELLIEVKNRKELRKKFGKKIVQNTIKIWNQLSLNLSAPVVASLISGMASLHLQSCRDSIELCNWWCGQDVMMDVNSKSLKAKSEFIHFFGLFALSENPVIVSKVISTLSTVVAELLHPKVSWAEDGNYITKISYTILTVFSEIPGNTQMMELVLKFIVNAYEILSTENPCCSSTRKKFAQAMNAQNDEKRQTSMANKLYELIFGQQTADYRKNLAATKYCLLPAISSMNERPAMKFFREHINDLVEKMQSKVATTKEQWILKISAANLIESLILLKTSRPFFGGSVLNKAYVDGLKPPPAKEDAKQLMKDVIRSSKFQNPSTTANEDIKKLIYHFNQAAYNVRIAIIKKEDITKLIKSSLELNTDDGRWYSVIDCNISYDFPVLLEPLPLNPENGESGE